VAAAIAVAGCGGDDGGDGSATTSAGAQTTTSTASTTTSTGSTTSTGGGTGNGQVGQESRTVRQTVDAALLSPDPAQACSNQLVTTRYLRVAYGGREGCEQAVSPQSVSESLGPYEEDINGSRATVKLHPSDGTYDGDVITVALVRENGAWKVDDLKSNAPVGP
jgi:hypothetical protein